MSNFNGMIRDSKIVLVYAPPGYGKSFLCLFFGVAFEESGRVFSNLELFHNGKKFSKNIKNTKELQKIEDSNVPGLIIMDEIGTNANSRRSMTQHNLDIVTELTIYPRKKNCSVVICAQVDNMFDVYMEKTSFMVIELLKPSLYYEDGKPKLLFKARISRRGKFVKYIELRLFDLLDMGYYFNSLDKSELEKQEKEKKEEKQIDKILEKNSDFFGDMGMM